MGLFDYQRTVIAYHGIDKEVIHDVLLAGHGLDSSKNTHDWLGHGIYFWEHGPHRAFEWAKWRAKHGGPGAKIKEPAVIGAVIQLGNCLDLLDTRNTRLLAEIFPLFQEWCLSQKTALPRNEKAGRNDQDWVKRNLDCAVINWALEALEKKGHLYHTVRGIFAEGRPAFEGSYIREKSHIQIAVRQSNSILGYFKPNIDFENA